MTDYIEIRPSELDLLNDYFDTNVAELIMEYINLDEMTMFNRKYNESICNIITCFVLLIISETVGWIMIIYIRPLPLGLILGGPFVLSPCANLQLYINSVYFLKQAYISS